MEPMKRDQTAARKRLGAFLRSHREDADLSQADMAAKLGMSQAAVSAIEKGLQKIPNVSHGYGLKENYSSAPLDPEDRRKHFDARNSLIQGGV